jgi:low affinity Fe/Cu permease
LADKCESQSRMGDLEDPPVTPASISRDGAAIQTKLDELIRSSAAQNRYIGIEHLTEEDAELRARYETRAKRVSTDGQGKSGLWARRSTLSAHYGLWPRY